MLLMHTLVAKPFFKLYTRESSHHPFLNQLGQPTKMQMAKLKNATSWPHPSRQGSSTTLRLSSNPICKSCSSSFLLEQSNDRIFPSSIVISLSLEPNSLSPSADRCSICCS